MGGPLARGGCREAGAHRARAVGALAGAAQSRLPRGNPQSPPAYMTCSSLLLYLFIRTCYLESTDSVLVSV